MNELNKEYFNDYCYFNLRTNGDKITLSYNVYSTLNESKNKEEKREFQKNSLSKVKKVIKKFVDSEKKVNKVEVDKDLDNIEIDEYVDSDGTMLTSKTPIINMYLHPRKTMDQTVVASRISNDPVTRGYRVYYGENENKEGNLIDEEDMSDAFGYNETIDKDYKETIKTFKKMGVTDPEERIKRTKQLGKIPNVKKRKGKLKQRLTEKDYIEEMKKEKMVKMVEDILANRGRDGEIMEKDVESDGVNKIITKNLESIKKLAKKEGISINKLINILKKDE